MKDGIIKADGTSRLARSVADFKTKYPTYNDFAAALVAGTLPLDILFNEAGWSQIPDFLGKASLFDGAAEAALDLPATALPKDALLKLKSLLDATQDVASGKAAVSFSTYVGTGMYGPSNPIYLPFDFEPKLVLCTATGFDIVVSSSRAYISNGFLWFKGITRSYGGNWQYDQDRYGSLNNDFSVAGNVLTVYGGLYQASYGGTPFSAHTSINEAGVTYNCVAVG